MHVFRKENYKHLLVLRLRPNVEKVAISSKCISAIMGRFIDIMTGYFCQIPKLSMPLSCLFRTPVIPSHTKFVHVGESCHHWVKKNEVLLTREIQSPSHPSTAKRCTEKIGRNYSYVFPKDIKQHRITTSWITTMVKDIMFNLHYKLQQ